VTRALHTVAALLLATVIVGPYAWGYTPSRDAEITQTYVASVDTSNNSNATVVLATGLQCTGLQPSSTYLVEVFGSQYAAAGTTGIRWRIGDGVADNDGSGSTELWCRDSATGVANAVFSGAQSPGTVTNCLGTASSATTVGNSFNGTAIWTTDATPSPVGVYFMSEVSSSAVTVKAGSMIRCRLLR
jgi:hypothetical protein